MLSFLSDIVTIRMPLCLGSKIRSWSKSSKWTEKRKDVCTKLQRVIPSFQLFRKSRKLQDPRTSFNACKLHFDVLDAVVEQVWRIYPETLPVLCLVSRNFYLVCIVWLYREITVDFSDPVARVLLSRLAQKSARLPPYVRIIFLKHCGEARWDDWVLLYAGLRQITRLQQLSWDHHADIPNSILNLLSRKHPRAVLKMKVGQMFAGSQTGFNIPVCGIFINPALGQLTSLNFAASGSTCFYPNFKRDLVNLLKRSPALTTLRIYRGPIESTRHQMYPEILEYFEGIRLPKLKVLALATRTHIFTGRELLTWGAIDGWPALRYLTISRASDLVPFTSRVPSLLFLDLTADAGVGMDDLKEQLEQCHGLALGPVQTLVYTHFIHEVRGARHRHILPWCIVRKIKGSLVNYNSHNHPVQLFVPGYAAPNPMDLLELSHLCPNLKTLRIDCRLIDDRWNWTYLSRLDLFRRLERLMLYVHRTPPINPTLRSLGKDRSGPLFTEAFDWIARNRHRRYHMRNFQVGFKLVRNFENSGTDVKDNLAADFIFKLDGSIVAGSSDTKVGKCKALSTRKKYATSTTKELYDRRRKLKTIVPLAEVLQQNQYPEELTEVEKELLRREKHERLRQKYGERSATLFDHWKGFL